MASSVDYANSSYPSSTSPPFPFHRISFDVIDYSKSPRTLIDWESPIQALVGNKAPAVIAGLEKLDPRFARGSEIRFPGRVNCEAFVATMHLLSKKRFTHTASQFYVHPECLQTTNPQTQIDVEKLDPCPPQH